MRALTAVQSQALGSPYRKVHYRVFVDATPTSGQYVDLTNLQGYDWLQDVSIDEQIDQPVSACTFHLARAIYRLSLNPMMGASKINNAQPLLAPGRRMFVETQTTAFDTPPNPGAYVRVFEGYIDDVDPSGESVEVACRDLGALLTDTYIETDRYYGNAVGVPVHYVMQQIIDDNINNPGIGAVQLYVPVVPTFLIINTKPEPQKKVTVFDALTALADQIAHTVRYCWDNTTYQFRLTLYAPDRTKTQTDYSFGPDDYDDITGLRISRKDIRNVVQVAFYDKESLAQLHQSVQATDLESIRVNGRRFMEISEASSSQIDTFSEARTMAEGALADLATPAADHEVKMDYFFPVQLGDYYSFAPNGKHYDSAQKFAVVAIKHELSADGRSVTTLTTRGKPATSYKRWLRLEGRPGVGPNSGYFDPATPGSVACTPTLAGLLIDMVPADTANWSRTEVFLDVSGIPIPSPATVNGKNVSLPPALLVAQGKQTQFTIVGLVPGKTYYGRVQVLDLDGNRSAASAQFSVDTQRSGPYNANTDNANAILNANCDFNAFTLGTLRFPDAWMGADANSVYGSNQTVFYDINAASGKYCMVLYTGCRGAYGQPRNGGYGGIVTAGPGNDTPALIPIAGGEIVTAIAVAKWEALPPNVTGFTASLFVDFYSGTVNGTTVTPTLINGVAGGRREVTETCKGATDWYMGFELTAEAPPDARWCSIGIYRNGMDPAPAEPVSGASSTGPGPWGNSLVQKQLYIDRVALTRGRPFVTTTPSDSAGYQYIEPNVATLIQLWQPYSPDYVGSDPTQGYAASAGFGVFGNTTFYPKVAGTASIKLIGHLASLNVEPTSGSISIFTYSKDNSSSNGVVATVEFKDLAQNNVFEINMAVDNVPVGAGQVISLGPLGSLVLGGISVIIQQTHEVAVVLSSMRLNIEFQTRKDL